MSLPTHNHTLASHSMGQLSSMKAFSSHASFFLSSVCQHENTSFVRDFCVFFFCSCPVFKPQNSPGREEEIRMNCVQKIVSFSKMSVAPVEPMIFSLQITVERRTYIHLCVVIYLEDVYLVTALVPSDTACLASSPGSRSLTAVWISRLVMVERLL